MNKSSVAENTDAVDHYPLCFVVSPLICCVQLVIVEQAFFVAQKNLKNNSQMILSLLDIFSSGCLLREIKRKTVCIRTKWLRHTLVFVSLERKEQYELQSHLLLGEYSNSPAVCVKISTPARVCVCAGVAFTILMLLASLNSCTNPWIYTAFSSSVSKELQNLLHCRSGPGRRGSLPDDSTTTHTSTTKDSLY